MLAFFRSSSVLTGGLILRVSSVNLALLSTLTEIEATQSLRLPSWLMLTGL